MLIIILLFVIFVVCIIIGRYLRNRRSEFEEYVISIALISLVALIVTAMSFINTNARFNKIMLEYEMTAELIESYTPGDYGNASAICDKVIEINETIANHKAYCNSIWTNRWYSEKIASLEPLKLK